MDAQNDAAMTAGNQQSQLNELFVSWFNSVLEEDNTQTEINTGTMKETPEDFGGVGGYVGDAGMTVLIGLVVVFAVLVVLTLVFKLFGMVMGKGNDLGKKSKPVAPDKQEAAAKKQQRQAKAAESKGQKAAVTPAKSAPAVQAGISGEVVAAIAAAVSCMAPDGKQYRVRSVSRVKGERPAWATAGIMENTRPF